MAFINCIANLEIDIPVGYLISPADTTPTATPATSDSSAQPFVFVNVKGYSTMATQNSGQVQSGKHYWGIKPDGSIVYASPSSGLSATFDVSDYDYVLYYSSSSAAHTFTVTLS